MVDKLIELLHLNTLLPNWAVNIATASSVFGLLVTIFLFFEAKKIKNQFLIKARLPESAKEIENLGSKISENLDNWKSEKNIIYQDLAKIKGIIENLNPKLPKEEGKTAKIILIKLKPTKIIVFKKSIRSLKKEKVWEIYTELQTFISQLKQLEKDGSWN